MQISFNWLRELVDFGWDAANTGIKTDADRNRR